MDNKGFTLTELMITVVIIAILAAIAVPMYTGYTQRARRADAYSALQTIALTQEKYFAEHGKYLDLAHLTSSFGLTFSGDADWDYDLPTQTDTNFVVRATPTTSRATSTIKPSGTKIVYVPCMTAAGVQGYYSGGTCTQYEWK